LGKDLSSLIVGIDEAGRGPLVGDMIIAYAGIPSDRLYLLNGLGVRDSKKLTRYQRSIIYNRLLHELTIMGTVIVSPYFIETNNLNKLTFKYILQIIDLIILYAKLIGVSEVFIYIDEVKGINKTSLMKSIDVKDIKLEVDVEAKADEKYPIVSAASIIAKYHRDRSLQPLKGVFGDLGSGYPSDPRTLEWLKRVSITFNEPPRIIRRKWRTLTKIAPRWFSGSIRRSILDYFSEDY
jgi:ribonuclease HII